MTKTLNLYKAKTNLSALVEEAAAGEEIVSAKNGRPRRQAGLFKGRIHFSEDWDAPWPEDIRRALEGENPIEPGPADLDDVPPAR